MDRKKDILWRAYVLYLVVVVMAIAIVWKIFQIQVIEGEVWREKAREVSTQMQKTEANRGNILAADESFLAISMPLYEVRMDLKVEGLTQELFQEHVDSLALQLAGLFGDYSASHYENALREARAEGNRYFLIHANCRYQEVKELKGFSLFRLGKNVGGYIIIQHYKRVKPYGQLASRTIGKVEDESRALGLEKGFDAYLKGTEGMQLMEKLAGGLWRPVDSDNALDPVDGYDLHTTIDPILQDVAEGELNNQLSIHGADHGCVILMEVATGDIKAIANLKKGNDGNYYESYNYAIGESMEPGSTMKLATMIALLEENGVYLEDSIATGNGEYRLSNDYVLKDSRTGGHGTISIRHSFEVSSNIAMAKAVKKVFGDNPQAFIDYLKKFHLGDSLKLPIPGEGSPRIKDRTASDWSALSLPMMAIGYETRVTPMHMLTLYNAVANDGKMVKPRFATHVSARGQVKERFETEVLVEKICSDETLDKIQDLLEGVVQNGTAQNLKNTVYKIAGKTGTAQISNSKDGYRSGSKINYQASFAGYFPAEDPQYTCIVVVNSPSNAGYTGNIVAGPIFKAVADKIYASSFDFNQVSFSSSVNEMVGRNPATKNGWTSDLVTIFNNLSMNHSTDGSSKWSVAQENKTGVSFFRKVFKKGIVPDFTNMGMRDAVFLAEENGLEVVVTGKGKVKKQSLTPGQSVEEGNLIYLELVQ